MPAGARSPVVPSNTEPWAPGTAFYGYDAMLDSRNMGYRGPAFSYARMPDQYTWKHFYDEELVGAPRSGDGRDRLRVVAHALDAGASPRAVVGGRGRLGVRPAARAKDWRRWTCGPTEQRVREAYGQSVEYTLGAMFSFLHTYDQPDLVLVVLGDHQPARIVSGPEADHDVPITIISKDPAVFEQIASWQWDAGVHPSPDAPVWRMDQFRDRFLEAFGG